MNPRPGIVHTAHVLIKLLCETRWFADDIRLFLCDMVELFYADGTFAPHLWLSSMHATEPSSHCPAAPGLSFLSVLILLRFFFLALFFLLRPGRLFRSHNCLHNPICNLPVLHLSTRIPVFGIIFLFPLQCFRICGIQLFLFRQRHIRPVYFLIFVKSLLCRPAKRQELPVVFKIFLTVSGGSVFRKCLFCL